VARYGPGMIPLPTCIVVMGVSGSGKTTVAERLAARLGCQYEEGDDHHPAANVEKMHAGIPLDDDDRRPWLEDLARWIGEREAASQNSVLTCSALKRSYRDLLRTGNESVWFAHVAVPQDVLAKRLEARQGHYMPASLLTSQLTTLEPLQPEEPGITVPGTGEPDEVVAEILDALRTERGVDS
jgi:gluconokinase